MIIDLTWNVSLNFGDKLSSMAWWQWITPVLIKIIKISNQIKTLNLLADKDKICVTFLLVRSGNTLGDIVRMGCKTFLFRVIIGSFKTLRYKCQMMWYQRHVFWNWNVTYWVKKMSIKYVSIPNPNPNHWQMDEQQIS